MKSIKYEEKNPLKSAYLTKKSGYKLCKINSVTKYKENSKE